MDTVKAIIIDDEKGAYLNLKELLSSYCPNIEVCGYAGNTQEAEQLIKTTNPELVFLDIQMPNETGIEFIKRIWPITFEVVFITAYDEYALKVFKLNALDYILKPINISYLQESMSRASTLIADKKNDSGTTLDERFTQKETNPETIVIKMNNGRKRFGFNEISHLHASGSYTTFFIQDHKNVTSGYNLAHFEEILPDDLFIRTHKSFLVNAKLVKQITSLENAPFCLMTNEELVPISRRRLSSVKSILS
jgi:two-component system LytT family response regulator